MSSRAARERQTALDTGSIRLLTTTDAPVVPRMVRAVAVLALPVSMAALLVTDSEHRLPLLGSVVPAVARWPFRAPLERQAAALRAWRDGPPPAFP